MVHVQERFLKIKQPISSIVKNPLLLVRSAERNQIKSS
jgi:hypothetical protein